MLYCNECGSITDGKKERETFEPGYGIEYMRCSFCGGENVENARQCPICGDYHKDEHEEGCPDCREHIINKYIDMLHELESMSDFGRDRVLEVMSSVFEDFYNKYI